MKVYGCPSVRKSPKEIRKKAYDNLSYYERKAFVFKEFDKYSGVERQRKKVNWYKQQTFYKKHKIRAFVQQLCEKEIKFKYLDLIRWLFVDLLRGRKKRNFGIYQFIALPGEGKTMSMVAHMERYRREMQEHKKAFIIATNFNYVHQDYPILHWMDIVTISRDCYDKHIPCLISMDEIHVTFDSTEWKDFPAELLAVLSFNRKYDLQFLVSAQIYERIPKKIRDIANFTVVCKNVLHLDRFFLNRYYEKNEYEIEFADLKGKKKKAQFTRSFVAGDPFYELYDTRKQVDRMVLDAKAEKKRREEASYVLYGKKSED